MPRTRTKPKLLVIFDTNVLYTKVASDLVRNDIRNLIQENTSHTDIEIKWYLPSVVINERRYQMRMKAFDLFPSLQKLEKLLGHNLNITENILIQRVDEAIQKEITSLNLNELSINTLDINWNDIIKRACFREPPFDPGEKEKGFRDSMIAEALFQLLSASPSTPSVCRLALVTDDTVLSDFVTDKTSDTNNLRVLSNINELENLINTLVSSVTEEFVSDLKDKAQKYFFEKDNQNTYYYKEDIRSRINEQYTEELKATPEPTMIIEGGTWWINPPVFIKKERQRVFWFSQIEIDCKFYKYQSNKSNTPSNEIITGGLGLLGGLQDTVQSNKHRQNTLLTGLLDMSTKQEAGEGKNIFEIQWSVNITQANNLTRPKLEGIKFIKHTWDDQ